MRSNQQGKGLFRTLLSPIHIINIRDAFAFEPSDDNFLVGFIPIRKPIVFNTALINRSFEPVKGCNGPKNLDRFLVNLRGYLLQVSEPPSSLKLRGSQIP